MDCDSGSLLRVVDIVEGTSVDGPGLRTSIYFAGCSHRCYGCHNPHTWDFDAGKSMMVEEIMRIVRVADFNVTFSGGDPLYQITPLLKLARRIKEEKKTIWCYTGFTFEEILDSHTLSPIIDAVDVIVDGPYIDSLRDISLLFRGSSNQRIIDCRRSSRDRIVPPDSQFVF